MQTREAPDSKEKISDFSVMSAIHITYVQLISEG